MILPFICLASIAMFQVGGVIGQMVEAPTHNYNLTSPVNNGPYVAGQILPCTYRLFSNVDTTGLDLLITLQAVGGFSSAAPAPSPTMNASSSGTNNMTATTTTAGAASADTANSNGTYIIDSHADVSRSDAFFKQEGNLTYFEHSINYNIMPTVKAGSYKVIFTDRSTNTNLVIPIEIRPAAPMPSPAHGSSPSGLDPNHSPGSIFTGNSASPGLSSPSTSFTHSLLLLVLVFFLVSWL